MENLKKEFYKKFICQVHPNDSSHHFKEATQGKLPAKILDFISQREKELLEEVQYIISTSGKCVSYKEVIKTREGVWVRFKDVENIIKELSNES